MPLHTSAAVYSPPSYSPPRYSPPRPLPTPRLSRGVVSPTVRKVAALNVQVPEQARVYVDDYLTKSTGKKRRYRWEKLQPGQVFRCRVRAETTLNGNKIQETKQVAIRAGTESNLVFAFTNAETTLTLRVPPSAKVYLGNAAKKGTGTVRVFRSKKLAAGQKVTDYPVRVSVVHNGQVISKEQRISLTSGESKTLNFRFDRETPVAHR